MDIPAESPEIGEVSAVSERLLTDALRELAHEHDLDPEVRIRILEKIHKGVTPTDTSDTGLPLKTAKQVATLCTGVQFAGRGGENLEAAGVAPWRSKDKGPELERLAEMAGEASAEAALAMEHAESVETPPRTANNSRPVDLTAAAFFDVDNTMMMGASIFHFARGLAARKYFTTSDLAGFAWQQLKFRVGGREYKQSIQSSREQILSFAAGRTVKEMVEVSEEIYDELMVDKIWPGTKALAQMHLDAGQRVWLVTATPVELAAIISRRLGLTGALGTVGETKNGVYTGRLVGDLLHGRAKAHAIRALAAREGLNLRRCTAYSDSQNDLPMLSAVGKAVAVNPDAGLRDIARARGWEIRDFRTGRKAAKIGVPSVLGVGAVAGAIAAVAYRRR